jgi:hypothetical protein
MQTAVSSKSSNSLGAQVSTLKANYSSNSLPTSPNLRQSLLQKAFSGQLTA